MYIKRDILPIIMGYLPEVVRIIAAHVEGPMGGKAIGTGFFLAVDGVHVKEEGLLLTNAHVVTNSPVVKIMTTYIEHRALPVTVVSVCHDRDLALLKVEPEVQQWLKRTLYDRYNINHIPAVIFGDSDTLRTGYKVHAVGHPLGLIDQQFTTGVYQGPVHINNEIRGLTSATINGGNSGGPLFGEVSTTGNPIKGLHYFIPSKYELMGINTFKLTGANVDGENGFINANTVLRALPMLMNPLETRYAREKKVRQMLSKMTLKQIMVASGVVNPAAAAGNHQSVQPLLNHLTENECAVLEETIDHVSWTAQKIGGLVKGKPRTFSAWMGRHVFDPHRAHMHWGGPELMSKVLQYTSTNDWNGLMKWKNNRRWNEVRSDLMSAESKDVMPQTIRILPPAPAHLHSPRVGITSHPIFSGAMLVHYKCPSDNGVFLANGGVLVTDIAQNSLFAKCGGQIGDIVFKFSNTTIDANLGPGGTWYSEKRDLPLSLTDLCNDSSVGENITLSVLRQNKGILTLSFINREPTYDELPNIRQTYGFCDEGRRESKQRIQVQGIIFAPLRLQHVGMFKLLEYMSPSNHHDFKVVIENVSPASPAYATDAVHAGSVLTHINDEPVKNTWEEVKKQLSTPHSETGCWVINAEYNGMKSKYAMMAQNIQPK
jgi:S1-C subfamily serine protease